MSDTRYTITLEDGPLEVVLAIQAVLKKRDGVDMTVGDINRWLLLGLGTYWLSHLVDEPKDTEA